ncbi:hypothetical protein ACWD6R_04555 [Streptomyces sp. NPDC005151]
MYDGKVKASLDKSVPQIGAPEVWAKGVDGKCVKAASSTPAWTSTTRTSRTG